MKFLLGAVLSVVVMSVNAHAVAAPLQDVNGVQSKGFKHMVTTEVNKFSDQKLRKQEQRNQRDVAI